MQYSLLILNLICPVVLFMVAHIMKKYPATDMAKQNGYNTPTSRLSQRHWDYAQQIAPEIYVSLAKSLLITEVLVSAGCLLFQMDMTKIITIGTCIGFGFVFMGFYLTDEKVKETMGDAVVSEEESV